MRNRIVGVREITKGEKYEINYMVNHKRFQHRVEASSFSEAFNIRLEHIAEERRELNSSLEDRERLSANFSEAWNSLNSSLLSDTLPEKTIGRYKKTYTRLLKDFRDLKYPNLQSFNQLRLSFFEEYKNYYVNDLGRPKGWRGELIVVKSIMQRLYRLGFCKKELIESLQEIKRPQPNKKEYPDIPNNKIKELLRSIKQDGSIYFYLIYFICRTGRRINETTLIEKRDVEWQGLKPIRINIRAETTKTRVNSPLIKLDPELEHVIKESYNIKTKRKSIFLFPNRLGRKCTPGKVRDYLKKKSEEVIGTTITPHYFRHRFLTECGKASMPMVDVMSISGIKDTDVIIKYYSHITPEGLAKVLEASRL